MTRFELVREGLGIVVVDRRDQIMISDTFTLGDPET
jgi:hypothetical protein